MDFRTTFNIEKPVFTLGYADPVLFAGSCFANEIGGKMAGGKMKALVNPCGTVYNPASIESVLRLALSDRVFTARDLSCYEDRYFSFLHYTDFSSYNPSESVEKINHSTRLAHDFLKEASFLFITFGTARVYTYLETGKIVSNCHKLPGNLFSSSLLSVDSIVGSWFTLLDDLKSFNPALRVIFTISPVRHWKDGAHGNQVSKSHLFIAIEELMKHPLSGGYFPAYELVMDDLRDYRFYENDMLHPSSEAVNYIWEKFTEAYFSSEAVSTWTEVSNVLRALKHRLPERPGKAEMQFSRKMTARVEALQKKFGFLDFSDELEYFRSLS